MRSTPVIQRAAGETRCRAIRALAVALLLLAPLLGCDRNIEPYVPGEQPRQPDLARIFPEPREPAGGPGGAPAMAAAAARGNAPAAGGAATAGGAIRGTIDVAPDLAAGASGGVLFVIARPGAARAGPPMAVLRIPAPSFPMRFEIGQGDVMMPGVQFAGEVNLTARLDSDGNAMTKLAGDLSGGVSDPIQTGTEDVLLLLDTQI